MSRSSTMTATRGHGSAGESRGWLLNGLAPTRHPASASPLGVRQQEDRPAADALNRTRPGQRGLTLIELLTTISIMVILLMLVAPSYHDVFLNTKLTNQANDFVSSLILARSEAIKGSVRVTVCKSSNGTACQTTGTWEAGWLVFRDTNGNGSLDAGESVIQRGDPLNTGFRLVGSTEVGNYVSYTSIGVPRLANGNVQSGTLTLCRANPSVGSQGRRILIDATGRVSVDKIEGMTTCPPA